MSKLTTACKCGSQEFLVFETIIHDGEINKDYGDQKLHCHNGNAGGIDRVVCKKCDHAYAEDEIDVEIEFN